MCKKGIKIRHIWYLLVSVHKKDTGRNHKKLIKIVTNGVEVDREIGRSKTSQCIFFISSDF